MAQVREKVNIPAQLQWQDDDFRAMALKQAGWHIDDVLTDEELRLDVQHVYERGTARSCVPGYIWNDDLRGLGMDVMAGLLEYITDEYGDFDATAQVMAWVRDDGDLYASAAQRALEIACSDIVNAMDWEV
jgi:hypothetical protein